MRLADFIEQNLPQILGQWESFAASLLPAAAKMDTANLRDHAEQILRAVVQDLRTPQTLEQSLDKSLGRGDAASTTGETAAQTHALLRASSGFTIRQLVAEYRALRASVLALWARAGPEGANTLEDMGRFNEAIDQAITESVDFYSGEVDRWRNVFLGVLGHDLRGPLNALLLTARVIAELGDGTPLSDPTKRLIHSGHRMKELLDDLLDYNRSALDIGLSVTPRPVDLAAVCQEEIELQRAALPTTAIQFAATGSALGMWDPSRIKQLLANLVINASKYGDQPGTVTVRLQGHEAEVRISVDNTGRTIPADDFEWMFEPMRRGSQSGGDSERTSLGLGLFIVREIARAHGGSVSAASADRRTTFTVALPRRAGADSSF